MSLDCLIEILLMIQVMLLQNFDVFLGFFYCFFLFINYKKKRREIKKQKKIRHKKFIYNSLNYIIYLSILQTILLLLLLLFTMLELKKPSNKRTLKRQDWKPLSHLSEVYILTGISVRCWQSMTFSMIAKYTRCPIVGPSEFQFYR